MTTKPLNPRTSLIAILATLTLSCSPSLSTLIATPSHAEEPTAFAEVEVAGVGATQDEALRQAWSTAVAEVVGTMVDAKTVIQNNKLIQDQILVFSKGYVTKTQTLSTTVEGGVTRVRVRVTVQRSGVEQKIEQLRAEKLWVDAESLIAAAKSKDEMELKRAEMLGDALLAYEKAAGVRTKVAMIGQPVIVGDNVELRYEITMNQDESTLTSAASTLLETVERLADSVGNGNDLPVMVEKPGSREKKFDHDVFVVDTQLTTSTRRPKIWWHSSMDEDSFWFSDENMSRLGKSMFKTYHLGNSVTAMCERTQHSSRWPCILMGVNNIGYNQYYGREGYAIPHWRTVVKLMDAQGQVLAHFSKPTFQSITHKTNNKLYRTGDLGDAYVYGLTPINRGQGILFIDPRLFRLGHAMWTQRSENVDIATVTQPPWSIVIDAKLTVGEFAKVRSATAVTQAVRWWDSDKQPKASTTP